AVLRDRSRRTRAVCGGGAAAPAPRRELFGGELFDPGHGRAPVWHDAAGVVGAVLAAVRPAGGMGAALVSEPRGTGTHVVVAGEGGGGRGLSREERANGQ